MGEAPSTASTWDLAQYERFKAERSRPFYDLLALVRPKPGMRVVDLGCGTGELTRALHTTLGAREAVGIDSSPAMLANAASFAGPALRFEVGEIEAWSPPAPVDLVFSNAALQWVDDHVALLPRLKRALAPGGQFAVQMPANEDHASHVVANEVAREAPFAEELGGYVRRSSVLPAEEYEVLLHRLGFTERSVVMRVYGHELASREDVVEWVKGTYLTDYAKRLRAETYARFLARYREALFARIEDARPFFYTYKRVFVWAR